MNHQGNENGISESTPVKATLYRTIVVFCAIIGITTYTVVFALTLRSDIDSKADREEFIRYKTADSVTTRTILEKIQEIDQNVKELLKRKD